MVWKLAITAHYNTNCIPHLCLGSDLLRANINMILFIHISPIQVNKLWQWSSKITYSLFKFWRNFKIVLCISRFRKNSIRVWLNEPFLHKSQWKQMTDSSARGIPKILKLFSRAPENS